MRNNELVNYLDAQSLILPEWEICEEEEVEEMKLSEKDQQIELFEEEEKIMIWECPITGEVPADWTCPVSVIGGRV